MPAAQTASDSLLPAAAVYAHCPLPENHENIHPAADRCLFSDNSLPPVPVPPGQSVVRWDYSDCTGIPYPYPSEFHSQNASEDRMPHLPLKGSHLSGIPHSPVPAGTHKKKESGAVLFAALMPAPEKKSHPLPRFRRKSILQEHFLFLQWPPSVPHTVDPDSRPMHQ